MKRTGRMGTRIAIWEILLNIQDLSLVRLRMEGMI